MLLGVLVFPFRGGFWWCIISAHRPITSFVPKVGQSSLDYPFAKIQHFLPFCKFFQRNFQEKFVFNISPFPDGGVYG